MASANRLLELAGQINELASDDTIGLALQEIAQELAEIGRRPSPLEDLNPERLHPPTAWLRQQTVYDEDAGVYYEPFVKDGRVGYRVASNRPGIGLETYIYFNPSTGSLDSAHRANVFIYQGPDNDPNLDGGDCFIDIEDIGYAPGEQPVEGAEEEHAAWVAEHNWLEVN